MTEPQDDEQLYDEDVGPQDDAVIGRALRISMLVIVGLVMLGGIIFWLVQRETEGPGRELSVEAPERDTQPEASVLPPSVSFVGIGAESGVQFVHHNGAEGERFLPETMGGGAAFLDYDADGDQDLLLVDSDRWPGGTAPRGQSRLYENDGTGSFRDVTAEVGLSGERFYGTGVAAGDIDNDGFPDLFVAAVGENRFYRNRPAASGSGSARRFEEATRDVGLAGEQDAWSTSAGFFDYDRDGDLDLFVCNYVRWSKEIDLGVNYTIAGIGRAYGPPVNYGGSFPYLYRNDGGRFVDVSEAAGLHVVNAATGEPVAKSLGLAFLDVEGDGFLDVVVANDTVRNFFLRNTGDGRFEEQGEVSGLAYGRSGDATGAMGIDVAHFRNNEELAVGIGNFANEMTSLYVSQGDPMLYADQAIAEGIGAPSRRVLSFGVFFVDYDLDGRLDFLQVNGHLEEEIGKVEAGQTYRQPAQLFWNAGPEGARTFLEVEGTGALGESIVGRAATFADIDSDGDLDFLLAQTGGPARLIRNDQELGHHWLRIVLRGNGSSSNRDAIGAWVELTAGGVTQRRQVMPSRSYQSQVELPLTFGLGTSDVVESLRVVWPDGREQSLTPDTVDRVLRIEQES